MLYLTEGVPELFWISESTEALPHASFQPLASASETHEKWTMVIW